MPIAIIQRYVIGFILGSLITVALLYVMQAVIKSDKNPLNETPSVRLVDFVRVLEDEAIQTVDRKPKPPPPPQDVPPDVPKPTVDSRDTMGIDIGAHSPDIDINIDAGGFSSDGEYLPILKVLPVYPRRAQARGLEGYVLVEFCVTSNGSVKDPFVVHAEPTTIFDRAALNAALKFKYKPKVVNEQPVEVCGVQNRIVFEMEDE